MTQETKREKVHQQIFFFSILGFIVSLPFSMLFNNISIILMILNWLIEGKWQYKFQQIKKSPLAFLFTGIYALYVLSSFYSDNQAEAGFTLEQHLSLFIFPLILSSSVPLVQSRLKVVYITFIGTITAAMIITGILGVLNYYEHNQNTQYLFYQTLSKTINLHAVYFSFYVALSVFFILDFLSQKISLVLKVFLAFLILLHIFFIILLSSKTIIFALLLTLFFTFIFAGDFIVKSRLVRITLATVACIGLVVLVASIPKVKKRFTEAINSQFAFIDKKEYGELTRWTGPQIRYVKWKFITEILNEHNAWPFGVGIGDGYDLLRKKSAENGLYEGNKARGWHDYAGYNAHNQFFQYLLYIGIIGVSLFVITLFFCFRKAIHHKSYIYLSFLVIFLLFCMTESVLSSQKGIVFFAFFNAFFAFHPPPQDK